MSSIPYCQEQEETMPRDSVRGGDGGQEEGVFGATMQVYVNCATQLKGGRSVGQHLIHRPPSPSCIIDCDNLAYFVGVHSCSGRFLGVENITGGLLNFHINSGGEQERPVLPFTHPFYWTTPFVPVKEAHRYGAQILLPELLSTIYRLTRLQSNSYSQASIHWAHASVPLSYRTLYIGSVF